MSATAAQLVIGVRSKMSAVREIDWIHESRLCAEDEKWGAAVYALSMARPELAEQFEELQHEAYSKALALVCGIKI